MKKLIQNINQVKKSDINKIISKRLSEFNQINKNSNDELFSELCFCLMTANFNAEKSIKIQKEIDEGFLKYSEKKLAKRLKELGHRFPNTRAKYIVEARSYHSKLSNILKSYKSHDLRKYFAENVKGLGYKESSHYLRNIGFFDYAIIDFHIVDLLVSHKLISKPKNLSEKNYLEVESVLKKIGTKVNLSQGELDLYLWYIETGKIFK